MPVVYDNAPEPTGLDQNAIWAEVHVLPGETFRVEMGPGGIKRTAGILQVILYAPVESGTKALYDIVDLIEPEFDSKTLLGVQYFTPSTTNAQRTEDKSMWKAIVSCPFWYNEPSTTD